MDYHVFSEITNVFLQILAKTVGQKKKKKKKKVWEKSFSQRPFLDKVLARIQPF